MPFIAARSVVQPRSLPSPRPPAMSEAAKTAAKAEEKAEDKETCGVCGEGEGYFLEVISAGGEPILAKTKVRAETTVRELLEIMKDAGTVVTGRDSFLAPGSSMILQPDDVITVPTGIFDDVVQVMFLQALPEPKKVAPTIDCCNCCHPRCGRCY